MAHHHTFDLDTRYPTRVACTHDGCGFSVPAILLKSRVNMEAFTARRNCTEAVLDLLGVNRDGSPRQVEA